MSTVRTRTTPTCTVARGLWLASTLVLAIGLVSPALAQPVIPIAPVPVPAQPLPLSPADQGLTPVPQGEIEPLGETPLTPEILVPSETGTVTDVPPPPVSPVPMPQVPMEPRTGPWVVNFKPVPAFAAPDESSEIVATLRQFTYLQLLGYEGEWARVYNPRTRATVYVDSLSLGETEAPPSYITADPPPPVEVINLPARVVRRGELAFYPSPDEAAVTTTLSHNAPVFISETVEGTDGETWYRTSEGDYLPEAAVRLPRPAPRTFPGKWIDADLNEPAMLVAYEGDVPVMASLTIKGTGVWPTPTGVFSIQRRVASETMSSDTIGIPRSAPGGYHLTGVLFTQYFLGSGESIHYNYWSGNFGYAASHGCLGLAYAESEFLWHWASVGTPVSIHY